MVLFISCSKELSVGRINIGIPAPIVTTKPAGACAGQSHGELQ